MQTLTIEQEEKEFYRQIDLWKEFYRTFNDDNITHCENALAIKFFVTSADVKEANEAWAKELLSRGTTADEILAAMKSSEEFLPQHTYKIPVVWEMYSTITIEAASPEEAIRKAMEVDIPLPEDGYYVDDSFSFASEDKESFRKEIAETEDKQ